MAALTELQEGPKKSLGMFFTTHEYVKNCEFLGAWRMHWAVHNVQYVLWAVVVLEVSVLQWGGCRCSACVCVFSVNIGSTDVSS